MEKSMLDLFIEYRNKNNIKCSIYLDKNDNSGILVNDSDNSLIYGFYTKHELIEFLKEETEDKHTWYSSQLEKIKKEKDPLLREIYASGYTSANEDVVRNKMILINEHNRNIIEIDLHKYREITSQLTFKKGSDLMGNIHTWICESDGSGDKFRELINIQNNNYETTKK